MRRETFLIGMRQLVEFIRRMTLILVVDAYSTTTLPTYICLFDKNCIEHHKIITNKIFFTTQNQLLIKSLKQLLLHQIMTTANGQQRMHIYYKRKIRPYPNFLKIYIIRALSCKMTNSLVYNRRRLELSGRCPFTEPPC